MNTALHSQHTGSHHWWATAAAGAAALVIGAAAFALHDSGSSDPVNNKTPAVAPAEQPAVVAAEQPAAVPAVQPTVVPVDEPAVVVAGQAPAIPGTTVYVPHAVPVVPPSNGIVNHGPSTGLEYVPRTEMTKPR